VKIEAQLVVDKIMTLINKIISLLFTILFGLI
jgi:hypothetical protein